MDEKRHLTLISLPLLQGISALDMSRVILEKVTTQEIQLADGERFVLQGEVCNNLSFLVEGTLRATTACDRGAYTFVEYLPGPLVVEPEILYGIQRCYTSTYEAVGTCRLLLIPKNDVNRMLASIDVFRFNYLNLLSTMAVRRRDVALPSPAPDLRARICHFFRSHATLPTGRKFFLIRMSDLSRYLAASRVVISAVLHQMQDEGLLLLDRNYVEIPHWEKIEHI